ncbi:Very-long-chain enoyl-CoA reductase [Ceratocystis pirilliformis]|uniref:Very-long-chain enoyl-CoA reductase n=1 Tax=Ceratocystis pirilliformis TaxID=259994 RepID=A0ABR3Z6M5_9PEZI
MASTITVKLTNRAKPLKKLPSEITIPSTATVEDVKALVSKQCGIHDRNRIGLYYPTSKKTIKDRKALISNETEIMTTGEMMVKDLGPQIAWKTVFLVEYFGPILFHVAIVALRPYIYAGAATTPLSSTQLLVFWMIVLHFVKRELETLFVHKFSASTMPAFNIFKNSFFYWAFSGLLSAWAIYSPTSLAATADQPLINYAGLAVYVFGELSNGLVHLHLSSLRSPGGTERKIPNGYGFSLVTCPNYLFETISWLGVIIVSRNWAVTLFIAIGVAQMSAWAKGKERAYRKEFGDKYKKKRFVMLPGLV